jgi:hypothetical protein
MGVLIGMEMLTRRRRLAIQAVAAVVGCVVVIVACVLLSSGETPADAGTPPVMDQGRNAQMKPATRHSRTEQMQAGIGYDPIAHCRDTGRGMCHNCVMKRSIPCVRY